MAIALNTAGSWVAATATTQTVTLPTHATGNMLLVRVGFKHATMPTTVTCGTAGWAKVATEVNGTGGASSNGGGGVEVCAFWKEAASGAETNPVITFNGGAVAATPSAAVANSYSKGAGEAWVTPVGDGAAVAAATAISATIASHVSATNGDLIEVAIVTNDNTTLTVPTFTQTGLTLAAVVESPATALSSATSNDIAADGCYRIATAGTSSAAAVVTGTNSVADLGAAWTTRLRVEAAAPPSGTGAITVPSATVAGVGVLTLTATGAISVPAGTVAGTGAEVFTATGAVSVPAATVAGTGAEVFTATGAVTVPAATVDGVGDHTGGAPPAPEGTGAISVPAASVAGVGELLFTATGAIAVPASAVVGLGSEVFTGSGAISGQAPVVLGAGVHLEPVTGTGVITGQAPAIVGAGLHIENATGTGAITVPPPLVEGSGSGGVVASGGGGRSSLMGQRRRRLKPTIPIEDEADVSLLLL